jgi:hypothetical protein
MEYIITAVVAFIIGWKISNWVSAAAFKGILEDLGVPDHKLEDLINRKYGGKIEDEATAVNDDGIELEVMEIKIEQHQGQLYAFRVEDDRFLGQGKTKDELIGSLTQNLTNVRLIIAEENGAKLLTKEI